MNRRRTNRHITKHLRLKLRNQITIRLDLNSRKRRQRRRLILNQRNKINRRRNLIQVSTNNRMIRRRIRCIILSILNNITINSRLMINSSSIHISTTLLRNSALASQTRMITRIRPTNQAITNRRNRKQQLNLRLNRHFIQALFNHRRTHTCLVTYHYRLLLINRTGVLWVKLEWALFVMGI